LTRLPRRPIHMSAVPPSSSASFAAEKAQSAPAVASASIRADSSQSLPAHRDHDGQRRARPAGPAPSTRFGLTPEQQLQLRSAAMSADPSSSPVVEKAQSARGVASALPSASVANLAMPREATVNDSPANALVVQQENMADVPPVPLNAPSGDVVVNNPEESHRAEEGATLAKHGARESAVAMAPSQTAPAAPFATVAHQGRPTAVAAVAAAVPKATTNDKSLPRPLVSTVGSFAEGSTRDNATAMHKTIASEDVDSMEAEPDNEGLLMDEERTVLGPPLQKDSSIGSTCDDLQGERKERWPLKTTHLRKSSGCSGGNSNSSSCGDRAFPTLCARSRRGRRLCGHRSADDRPTCDDARV